jgi:hypothetical protein
LRSKQIPENVYLIELLQHDLEEYMETILYWNICFQLCA